MFSKKTIILSLLLLLSVSAVIFSREFSVSARRGAGEMSRAGYMSDILRITNGVMPVLWIDPKYSYESNAKYFDLSGNANHGIQDTEANQPAVNPPGLYFNGTSDYLDCGDIDSLDGVSQFTLSAWVKPASFGDWKRVVSKDKAPDGNEGIIMGSSNSTHGGIEEVALVLHLPPDWALGWTTNDILTIGEWHHWTMVFDGSGVGDAARMKFYFDGAQQTLTFDGSAGIPAITPNTNYPVRIGEQNDTEHNGLNGSIDSVRIYDTALSAGQIQALYLAGLPRYR